MAFTEQTVWTAFVRSGGRCECSRQGHGHVGRCTRTFGWNDRGGYWQAHHRHAVASGGGDSLSNCEVTCTHCHPKVDAPRGR